MSKNIQITTTGQIPPCLQQSIDKTRYLVEIHFSDTSSQNVEDKLKSVILHDLKHGKQSKPKKNDEYVLGKLNRNNKGKCTDFLGMTIDQHLKRLK